MSFLHRCFALLCGGLILGLLPFAPAPMPSAQPGNDGQAQEAPLTDGLRPQLEGRIANPSSGTAQEQHLASLGVDRWHQKGIRGQQVKIAILDSGFQGYQNQLGKALPVKVTTRSFRSDGKIEFANSQHGVLCAEVAHAVAPAADLLLVNWEPNDPNSFLDAVHWVRDQKAQVISCSLIMPSWSDGEGGGVVNQGIAKITGQGQQAGDMLFFASAGNTAQRHWCGQFAEGQNGWHQWRNGTTDNTLTPWGKERIAVELYGPSAGDYELYVVDSCTGQTVGDYQIRHLGARENNINCLLVRFAPDPGQICQIKLRAKKPLGPGPRDKLHLVVLGGDLAFSCPEGSISCPADGAGVCAVGAVNQTGQRWHYSSCGPNSALPKPDYVAIVPFPSSWRPQPFSGTSAAAPQAAGLAALWWSKNPAWNANQIKDALRQTALDIAPPGHDYETGYGMLRVP